MTWEPAMTTDWHKLETKHRSFMLLNIQWRQKEPNPRMKHSQSFMKSTPLTNPRNGNDQSKNEKTQAFMWRHTIDQQWQQLHQNGWLGKPAVMTHHQTSKHTKIWAQKEHQPHVTGLPKNKARLSTISHTAQRVKPKTRSTHLAGKSYGQSKLLASHQHITLPIG